MPSIPLIAVRTLVYAGRVVSKGDRFLASSEQDARLLKKLGRATDAHPPSVYRAASVEPEPPAEAIPVDISDNGDGLRKKRTYRRRDLTAETSE